MRFHRTSRQPRVAASRSCSVAVGSVGKGGTTDDGAGPGGDTPPPGPASGDTTAASATNLDVCAMCDYDVRPPTGSSAASATTSAFYHTLLSLQVSRGSVWGARAVPNT